MISGARSSGPSLMIIGVWRIQASRRLCARRLSCRIRPPMPSDPSAKPGLAVISNSCPPYRLHILLRIARELPQVRLFSVFTHQMSSAAWAIDPPAEIGPVSFGPGEPAELQTRPSRALHEWRKGGKIIQWMRDNHIRAAVIHGYNSPGLLRIIRWCDRNGVACLLHADSNI